MINKKEAKLLNRPFTIDLKAIHAREYLDSIETKTITKSVKSRLFNLFVLTPFYFWLFILIFIWMWIVVSYIIPDISFAESDNNYYLETINTPIPKFLYDNLLIECKNNIHWIKNYHHCLKTWLAIAYAESTMDNQNNYFWLTSDDKSIKSWVSRYSKYWYKAKNWAFFYWSNWKAWPSMYCLSEFSSDTNWWCPNWQKNFNHIFLNQELDQFIKNTLITN